MSSLRLWLLLGLVAHKGLWEILRRREDAPAVAKSGATGRPGLRPLKAAKAAVLVGLVAQTLAFPSVLPISRRPRAVRAFGSLMYVTGLTTAMLGRLQLGDNWANIEDAAVLPRQNVVSQGIYGIIRHPIYAGDVLLVAGLQLALNSWLVLGALPLAGAVFRRARSEERLLSRSLPGYSSYQARTRMFVPGLI